MKTYRYHVMDPKGRLYAESTTKKEADECARKIHGKVVDTAPEKKGGLHSRTMEYERGRLMRNPKGDKGSDFAQGFADGLAGIGRMSAAGFARRNPPLSSESEGYQMGFISAVRLFGPDLLDRALISAAVVEHIGGTAIPASAIAVTPRGRRAVTRRPGKKPAKVKPEVAVQLSADAEKMIAAIPATGAIAGAALQAALGWDLPKMKAVRAELKAAGLIIVGRGRGGKYSRIAEADAARGAAIRKTTKTAKPPKKTTKATKPPKKTTKGPKKITKTADGPKKTTKRAPKVKAKGWRISVDNYNKMVEEAAKYGLGPNETNEIKVNAIKRLNEGVFPVAFLLKGLKPPKLALGKIPSGSDPETFDVEEYAEKIPGNPDFFVLWEKAPEAVAENPRGYYSGKHRARRNPHRSVEHPTRTYARVRVRRES